MSKPKYEPLSEPEVLALPVSVPLETAGRAFGFGRTQSHELTRAGELPCPVKRFGARYVVLRADLLAALGYSAAMGTAAPASGAGTGAAA